MIIVFNLSNEETCVFKPAAGPMTTPASAVMYCAFNETDRLTEFFTKHHDGEDWDKWVKHGKVTVAHGNWAAFKVEPREALKVLLDFDDKKPQEQNELPLGGGHENHVQQAQKLGLLPKQEDKS